MCIVVVAVDRFFLYSPILHSRADSLRSHVILDERIPFYSALYFFLIFFFLNIYRSGVLTALAWLVPRETAAVSAQVLCTPYNHAPCHHIVEVVRVFKILPLLRGEGNRLI